MQLSPLSHSRTFSLPQKNLCTPYESCPIPFFPQPLEIINLLLVPMNLPNLGF